MRLHLATAAALLFAANLATAESVQTVLTPDSTLYAIEMTGERARLELTRRHADVQETLTVPSTDDEATETDPRIAFDNGTLYVVWHRQAEGIDEIRLARLNAAGEWSEVRVVAGGADVRRAGLQMTLTHAQDKEDETEATLVHATWWDLGTELTPRYAIVAFENGLHLSTELASLRELAELQPRGTVGLEETDVGIHPPLALARAGSAVDVVFGDRGTTTVTRVRVEPRRISSNARFYRPGRGSGGTTGPARLVSASTAPVQAFVSGDRIVLYTPDAKFRYSIFADGQWTPVRMIELDENITSDHLLRELRRTVEEGAPLETNPQSE